MALSAWQIQRFSIAIDSPSATNGILSVTLSVPSVSLWFCLFHKANDSGFAVGDAADDGGAGEAADHGFSVLGVHRR